MLQRVQQIKNQNKVINSTQSKLSSPALLHTTFQPSFTPPFLLFLLLICLNKTHDSSSSPLPHHVNIFHTLTTSHSLPTLPCTQKKEEEIFVIIMEETSHVEDRYSSTDIVTNEPASKSQHEEVASARKNEPEPGRVYSCWFCPRIFDNPQACGGHQNRHRKERSIAKSAQLLHWGKQRRNLKNLAGPCNSRTRVGHVYAGWYATAGKSDPIYQSIAALGFPDYGNNLSRDGSAVLTINFFPQEPVNGGLREGYRALHGDGVSKMWGDDCGHNLKHSEALDLELRL